MNIYFILNNEDETQITSFHDMASNPFKLGDEVSLNIDDLFPIDYNSYKPEFQKKLMEDNKLLRDQFHMKRIKLVKEGKYMRTTIIGKTKLTIEYHCEIID